MSDNDLSDARILVVDDESINLAILEELLEQAGYSDIVCESIPEQAIQLYQQQQFDIVLLDLNMPRISGFDVMDAFKEHAYSTPPPVIVLTAFTDKAVKLRALTNGASDFLTKPFDHQEVISRVENLIKLQLSQKQLHSQNEILAAKVQTRTQQLNEAKLDAIYRLGLVADYRDTETGEHTKRVGLVSEILARAIGLDEESCELILHAAPMHDIGKIGIPDNILLKPGKLNKEEWQVMKQHTVIGGHMLADSPTEIIKLAYEIALTHHEKWDGSGYPAGLKAEDIPIAGRIVIIVDVYDALSSDRPYKKAWEKEKIIAYMKEQSGIMFDPNLLDKFFEYFAEIQQITDLYSDVEHSDNR